MPKRTPFEWARRWRLDRAVACSHTFVFGAYPVLVVVGANAGIMPLDGAVVARALAVSIALTAALLMILWRVIPDLPARAAYLSSIFIAFILYPVAGGTSTHPGRAALYVLASGILAAAIVRPWTRRSRRSTALNVAAAICLAINLYVAARVLRSDEPWRPAADALIERVVASAGGPPAGVRRDIYHVVLDGFGRPDVLKELYDLDLDPFVRALESRGFVVPDAGRSNYAQTFLSLGSTLNLSYLDEIAGAMRDSGDRRVLDYLIQHNALGQLARREGYRVIGIGSDYTATERLTSSDECFCERYGLQEIEVAAVNLTPLRALPLRRWTYDAHRRKIEQSFDHLERAASGAAPTLVFAHLIAPHPPFVFGPGERSRSNGTRTFGFEDGSHYLGPRTDYVAGYRDQAQYIASRLLAVVDRILSRRGPAPVIVLHGDHGPGSMWDWNDLEAANARERLAIFSAYYFPGDDRPVLPRDLSPVNGLRILANRHLGTALPPLPELSFASTWRRPYELVRVAETEAAGQRGAAPRPRN